MEIYWAGRALGERKFALASMVEIHVSSAAENMTLFSKQNIPEAAKPQKLAGILSIVHTSTPLCWRY